MMMMLARECLALNFAVVCCLYDAWYGTCSLGSCLDKGVHAWIDAHSWGYERGHPNIPK